MTTSLKNAGWAALLSGCGGSSSSGGISTSDRIAGLPVQEYTSASCLTDDQAKAIGIDSKDITVKSACIHNSSTSDHLVLETRKGYWVQILYSDSIIYEAAAKEISRWDCLSDLESLFTKEILKWKSLSEDIKQEMQKENRFLSRDCRHKSVEYKKAIMESIKKEKFFNQFYLAYVLNNKFRDIISRTDAYSPNIAVRSNRVGTHNDYLDDPWIFFKDKDLEAGKIVSAHLDMASKRIVPFRQTSLIVNE